jgi:hypothetical protein
VVGELEFRMRKLLIDDNGTGIASLGTLSPGLLMTFSEGDRKMCGIRYIQIIARPLLEA